MGDGQQDSKGPRTTVIDMFTRNKKIDGGAALPAPPSLAAELRALADMVEQGELPDVETLILVPCGAAVTCTPSLLGTDISTAAMLGKMVLAQSLLVDDIKNLA